MMRLLPLVLLAGCAHAPAELERIHHEVGQRITYTKYYAKDFRWIRKGQTATGNCAVFAATYRMEAARYGAEVVTCRLPDGTGHAYARVGDYALDNRYAWVIPITEQECK